MPINKSTPLRGAIIGAGYLINFNMDCQSRRNTRARFTFGTMRIDDSKGHLQMDLAGDIMFKPLWEPPQSIEYNHPRINFTSDCCYQLQRHFAEQLLNNQPFEGEANDYLNTLQLVEACYESAKTGQVTTITQLD